MSDQAATLPSAHVRIGWVLALLAIASATTGAVFLLNRILGAPVTETNPRHTLRVMTWNIGKLYIRGDSRAADSDLRYVAAVIRSQNPHVVALQEIRDEGQLAQLVGALGPGWRGRVPEDRWDRRAALLVRLHAHFHPIATSTGRTVQAAVIDLPDGPGFTVVSVHLDAFNAKRRLVQAEEIVAAAQRLAADDLAPHRGASEGREEAQFPMVASRAKAQFAPTVASRAKGEILIAGDFNIDPSVAAHGSIDQDLYRFMTRHFVDAGVQAGATTFVHWRLDYVFYRSARVKKATARALRDRRINIMDHDPLVVELGF